MVIPPVFFADPTFLHNCLSFRSALVCLSFILEGNAEPLRNLMLSQELYKMFINVPLYVYCISFKKPRTRSTCAPPLSEIFLILMSA